MFNSTYLLIFILNSSKLKNKLRMNNKQPSKSGILLTEIVFGSVRMRFAGVLDNQSRI